MKVSILHQGNFTLSVASAICQSGVVSEMALLDEHQKLSREAVQDLEETAALAGFNVTVSASRTAAALANSKVVILPPLTSRTPVLSAQRAASIAFARHAARRIRKHAPRACILVAMPPANFLSALIHHEIKAVPGQVMALSSVRANAHLKSEIAKQIDVSVEDIAALEIGNDEKILMLPQYCRVNGIPLDQLLDQLQIQNLNNEVSKLHKVSAHTEAGYTLSACLQQMIKTIGRDKKKIMSIGTLIEASRCAVFLSVPAKIGSCGAEEIMKLQLTDQQNQDFAQLVSRSLIEQQAHS